MKETQFDKEKQVWDSWQPGSCLPLGVLFDTGSRGTVWWSVHDVAFVATADSSEISNSVPAARSFAGDTHSADQSAACARDHSCRMAVACEQAENPARGSCDAKKQWVYRRCKRNVTDVRCQPRNKKELRRSVRGRKRAVLARIVDGGVNVKRLSC
jgi:hypothetical protein